MNTEIIEEEQKIDAVVSVIPENYLTDSDKGIELGNKSKTLFKMDNHYGYQFAWIINEYKWDDMVKQNGLITALDSDKLYARLKGTYSDSYDDINKFMNQLNRLKEEYVIVTKTGSYGNTQVRNYVKQFTPTYNNTNAWSYGLFVNITQLLNIWNNFKPDYQIIDKAKKNEQQIRYDFNCVQEVKRQLKNSNYTIGNYKNDLEFFFFDRSSLEAEIQNQTLRVVKTVRREPSESEDRFHRVLSIIEKLHPKSQSNIKSSEWTSSGEGYELGHWKKELTVTREQVNNHTTYLNQTKVDDYMNEEKRLEYIEFNKVTFRDLTISLLDLAEANDYILELVSTVADMIEDIVLN